MNDRVWSPSRRLFLGGLATSFFTVRGLFAEELSRTPSLTEGPFYPDKLPLDTDNDLIIINNSITPAVGEITHLTGKVLDAKGNPIKNALVEIWQCDANGVYLHTGDSDGKKDKQDRNFQGFGRFLANASGEYYFRTIKPVVYPGRQAPHIHFKVKRQAQPAWFDPRFGWILIEPAFKARFIDSIRSDDDRVARVKPLFQLHYAGFVG